MSMNLEQSLMHFSCDELTASVKYYYVELMCRAYH